MENKAEMFIRSRFYREIWNQTDCMYYGNAEKGIRKNEETCYFIKKWRYWK